MAVILDSTSINRSRQRRRLGVSKISAHSKGNFGVEISRRSFFFLPSERGSLGAVSPPSVGFWLLTSNRLIYRGICFIGIHNIQPIRDVS